MRLFDAGVTMVRLNMSHGTLKSNLKMINKLKTAKRLRPHKTIGFMLEARGREIRLNQVTDPSGVIKVKSGTVVALNCLNPHGFTNPKTWYCNCDVIQRYLKPNDVVYIDDGKVVCIVLEISNEGCMLEVKIGGPVRSYSQIRFIGGKHKNINVLSHQDMKDLQEFSKAINIDYLVVPFASSNNDIKQVKECLGEEGKNIKIIAKIDTINGIEHFDEILTQADGMIFCRNELQWEVPSEKLMIAQKWATQQCNKSAKVMMIQSQVLESMLENGQPSRPELTEITTATLDGVDSFILSHETSIGKRAIETTVNLAKSIAEAEAVYDYDQVYVNNRDDLKNMTNNAPNIDILTTTSCQMAFEKESDVDIIVCLTDNGKIASYLSKQRTRQPVLACSTNSQTVRQVNTFRGVVGYKIPQHMEHKGEEVLDLLLKIVQEQGLCNLPYSKVMIFQGENEGEVDEKYTFKMIGGEEIPDEEEQE